MEKSWKSLRVGDWVICPVDAVPEKVTASRAYARGRWFVRTTRHDHMRPADEKVTLADS